MNIKAFVDGVELPVKIMQSTDEYAPIKAIGTDGTIYDLSLSFVKLDNKSERTKERIKVSIYGEASDFGNIDNPLSFLL